MHYVCIFSILASWGKIKVMQLFFMIKGGKGDIMGKDMTSDKDKGRFKRKYSLGVVEV